MRHEHENYSRERKKKTRGNLTKGEVVRHEGRSRLREDEITQLVARLAARGWKPRNCGRGVRASWPKHARLSKRGLVGAIPS
jgi:hypothetical protein